MKSPAPLDAGRLPGLDGLRVLSVLVIIFYHQGLLPFGWIGVQVFFVLSGYLITRLLWNARERPLGRYLTGFWGRRVLRIFPLYYGALVALSVLAFAAGKGQILKLSLPYLATYTYNLWSATAAYRESRYFSHFWSLCVEEQFYLLWPFLIYVCRRGPLKAVLAAIVLAGPLIRLAEVFILRASPGANPLTDLSVYVLTPTYFDGFAIGAWVGLFPLGGKKGAFFASFAFLVIATWLAFQHSNGLRDTSGTGPGYVLIWGYSLVNLFAALLIDCLVFRKLAPRFFDAGPMQYLGKISYGLYVFHLPIQTMLEQALPRAGVWPRLGLQLILTVAVSALSFRFWERPFLALKDRFRA
ncbi:MAG TPA: acyltransferase [Myxococcales bacterium]|nr:acyltransferase [Myxococcales bacterium]